MSSRASGDTITLALTLTAVIHSNHVVFQKTNSKDTTLYMQKCWPRSGQDRYERRWGIRFAECDTL